MALGLNLWGYVQYVTYIIIANCARPRANRPRILRKNLLGPKGFENIDSVLIRLLQGRCATLS